MELFEDTAEDEIRRLRKIIAKLEETNGARIVTVEMAPRENGAGYLFYITAPTTASEAEFGLAMAATILKSFRVIGADMKQDIVQGDHIAPPWMRTTDCYIRKGAFDRWIIVNGDDLAWSGSRWVAHKNGLPTGGVQVSNFESDQEAYSAAREAGLTPMI